MDHVMTLCGYIACLFLAALAGTIIVFIWIGKIDLTYLVSETNHEASMSRFQLLIFTFVVAIGMFELIERLQPPGFPTIPDGVLTLLGISASTYAVGKGIQYSRPETLQPKTAPDDVKRAEDAAEAAQQAATGAANSQQASAAAADKAKGHATAAEQSATKAAASAQPAANAPQAGAPGNG